MAACAECDQQAIIDKAQGVGHGGAAHEGFASDARIAQVTAGEAARWRRNVNRVVDVVRVLGQIEIEGVALLGPDPGQAEVQFMGHRARGETAIEAGHGAGVIFFVGNERTAGHRAAIVAHQGGGVVVADFAGVLGAAGGVGGPAVVQVVFGAQHAEGVLDLAEAPLLRVVGVGGGRIRDVRGVAKVDRAAAAVDAFLRIDEIAGQA
ncbi:hypothetical protein D3C86_1176460 [compost metagenome]